MGRGRDMGPIQSAGSFGCCPGPRRCLARLLMIDRDEVCFSCGTRREKSVHEMNRFSRSQEMWRLCRSTLANMHERCNLNQAIFEPRFFFTLELLSQRAIAAPLQRCSRLLQRQDSHSRNGCGAGVSGRNLLHNGSSFSSSSSHHQHPRSMV